MKIIENEKEIILTDTPIYFWIIGASFSILGIFFILGFAVFAYQRSIQIFALDFNSISSAFSSLFSLLIIVLSLIFYFSLFLSMVLMSKITIKVNTANKSVEFSRTGLLKKQIDKYYFNQILRFDLETNPKTKYSQLQLVLANKAKIPLEVGSHQKDSAAQIVKKLNSFVLQ